MKFPHEHTYNFLNLNNILILYLVHCTVLPHFPQFLQQHNQQQYDNKQFPLSKQHFKIKIHVHYTIHDFPYHCILITRIHCTILQHYYHFPITCSSTASMSMSSVQARTYVQYTRHDTAPTSRSSSSTSLPPPASSMSTFSTRGRARKNTCHIAIIFIDNKKVKVTFIFIYLFIFIV